MLHGVDDVEEELLGVLLALGGELGVSLADQRPEHPRPDAGSQDDVAFARTGVRKRIIAGKKAYRIDRDNFISLCALV